MVVCGLDMYLKISIHSSRTGGDCTAAIWRCRRLISIHSSRTGGDCFARIRWGAWTNFNPLLPHGRRLGQRLHALFLPFISIHSSRTGGDAALIMRCA